MIRGKKFATAAMALALIAAHPAPAPTAGEAFAAEVMALGDADPAAWAAAHGLKPDDADALQVAKALKAAAPLKLLRLEDEGGVIEATMTGRAGSRAFRVVGVPDRAAPGRLRALFAVPVPTPYPMPATIGAMSEAELTAALDRRVAFAAERDDFSGTVVVRDGDRVVYRRSVGTADRAKGVANGPDTRFNIGSMGKMFTAVAVMQQIEAGRLTLDTSVGQVLPEYPNQAGRAVTVRQLLTHQAGLGMLFERKGWDRRARYSTAASILPAFAAEPLRFAPGSRSAYSNEGFVLLAAMVEKVSGLPFETYLAQRVFAPAGISGVFQGGLDETLPGRAVAYRFADADMLGTGERETDPNPMSFGSTGAGGQFATADEMLRFLGALHGGKLVGDAGVKALTSPGGGLRDYGLGFQVIATPTGTLVGHNGGGPHSGVNAEAMSVPATGWSYAVMGNYDAPFAQALGRDVGAFVRAMR
ncbi:MAG TPA: serine hydrolase domain-containing protein [Sphingomonas sp.]